MKGKTNVLSLLSFQGTTSLPGKVSLVLNRLRLVLTIISNRIVNRIIECPSIRAHLPPQILRRRRKIHRPPVNALTPTKMNPSPTPLRIPHPPAQLRHIQTIRLIDPYHFPPLQLVNHHLDQTRADTARRFTKTETLGTTVRIFRLQIVRAFHAKIASRSANVLLAEALGGRLIANLLGGSSLIAIAVFAVGVGEVTREARVAFSSNDVWFTTRRKFVFVSCFSQEEEKKSWLKLRKLVTSLTIPENFL